MKEKDIPELRKTFARLLRQTLQSADPVEFGFHEQIAAIDADVGSALESDRSLNAAWYFVDDYLDALSHRFEDIGGIPLAEARGKLLQIIDAFDKAEDIKDESILRSYHEKARRLRFKPKFPWIYRE